MLPSRFIFASATAPSLFYLRPSMDSYLQHLTHMDVGNAKDCMEQSPPCSRRQPDKRGRGTLNIIVVDQ
jgi:hypothetical protein